MLSISQSKKSMTSPLKAASEIEERSVSALLVRVNTDNMSPRRNTNNLNLLKQRKLIQNSVNYQPSKYYNNQQDSRDALSILNGSSYSNNQTASQTAISVSTNNYTTLNKRRLKKDYFSRLAAANNAINRDTFLSQADISNIDIDVPNAEVFLATSKPSSVSSKKEISSPSMKAYKTKAWAEVPSM